MELKDYLQIIKKYPKIFWGIWGSIVFLGLFTMAVQPAVYQGETTAMVLREHPQKELKVTDRYDYYYQLEANRNISTIVKSIFKDKAVLLRSLRPKGEGNLQRSISSEEGWIISRLRTEDLGAGYVKLIVKTHQPKGIEKFFGALEGELNNKVALLGGDSNRILKIKMEPAIITPVDKMYLTVGLASFFGGLLVAVISVLGVEYFGEGE